MTKTEMACLHGSCRFREQGEMSKGISINYESLWSGRTEGLERGSLEEVVSKVRKSD